MTQRRQLVSCDWSWQSHGSLVPGKFNLKINRRSVKHSDRNIVELHAPTHGLLVAFVLNQISVKLFLVVFLDAARTVIFLACHLFKLENASVSIAKKKFKTSIHIQNWSLQFIFS